MDNTLCPRCHELLQPGANFCSHCGYKLNDSLSTSLSTQLGIYLVSFFLAPFGLGFVFKYLRHGGKAEKRIGYVALALTLLAIALMFIVNDMFLQSYKRSMDGLLF